MGFWEFLWLYQTLFAGMFAVLAAFVGARALRREARERAEAESERLYREAYVRLLAMLPTLSAITEWVAACNTTLGKLGCQALITDRDRNSLTLPLISDNKESWFAIAILPADAIACARSLQTQLLIHNREARTKDLSNEHTLVGLELRLQEVKRHAESVISAINTLPPPRR